MFNIDGARYCIVTGEFLSSEVSIIWHVVSSKGDCCIYDLPPYKRGHHITMEEKLKATITCHRIHILNT